jgi:hypothetical protein
MFKALAHTGEFAPKFSPGPLLSRRIQLDAKDWSRPELENLTCAWVHANER